MLSMILMVAIAVFVLRRVCGVGAWRGAGLRGMRWQGGWGCGMRGMMGVDVLERAKPRAAPAPRVESPLESLQRRFAAGTISVEEYEREVGRLYGVKSAEPN